MSTDLGWKGAGTAAIAVTDMAASIAWYRDVLGCEVVLHLEAMGWCELSSPITGLTFGLQQVKDFMGATGGATLMFEVADIGATRTLLESRSVRFEGETMTIPGVVSLATFFDPTGNALKLYQDLGS